MVFPSGVPADLLDAQEGIAQQLGSQFEAAQNYVLPAGMANRLAEQMVRVAGGKSDLPGQFFQAQVQARLPVGQFDDDLHTNIHREYLRREYLRREYLRFLKTAWSVATATAENAYACGLL